MTELQALQLVDATHATTGPPVATSKARAVYKTTRVSDMVRLARRRRPADRGSIGHIQGRRPGERRPLNKHELLVRVLVRVLGMVLGFCAVLIGGDCVLLGVVVFALVVMMGRLTMMVGGSLVLCCGSVVLLAGRVLLHLAHDLSLGLFDSRRMPISRNAYVSSGAR